MTSTTFTIPTLQTDRLILRGAIPADQEDFISFLMSERARYAGGTDDRGKAVLDFADMVDSWSSRALGLLIITLKSDGRAIGHVGGFYPDGWPEIEIGWSLWQGSDEGKGYAAESARAVRDYAFDILGWSTAVSYIAPDNKPSITLAERLGATLDENAVKPDGLTCLVYRHNAAVNSDDDGNMEAYA